METTPDIIRKEFYDKVRPMWVEQSGLDESYGNGEEQIHNFSSSRNYNDEGTTINFLTTGQKAAAKIVVKPITE